MALSPLINAPIQRQDSVIEVVRKGDGSSSQDEAFITTSITLAQAIDDEEVTLILPMSGELNHQRLIRYTDDPVTDAVQFDDVDRSDYDQAVAEALQKLQDKEREEQQALADAIANAAHGFSQAVLKVQPGQLELRFFYSLAVPKADDGSNQLSVLAPLSSFIIQPGGSIGVVALMPRDSTVHEAVALQDPNNPNSGVQVDQATLGRRPLYGFMWQNDPLFKIRYS